MTGARQMFSVTVTFRKSNGISVQRWAGAYRSARSICNEDT